ncbi:MAG: hypothetical protein GX555_16650 [Actinomycetales bacterium]|nr:hypothetical protein [Actinomycetales bacterium]
MATTTNSARRWVALVAGASLAIPGVGLAGAASAAPVQPVTGDETSAGNQALEPTATAIVSGTVTDGSGYGFPLYAEVSVQGTSLSTYTDPVTGAYSVELPSEGTYTLEVVAQYPGYTTPSVELEVTGDLTEDITVPVDVAACVAPGYEFVVEGVTETFDAEVLPDGWAVVDHEGSGQVWQFDDPGDRGNLTGGAGGFAIQDSDEHGSGGIQDTSLVSPSVDMSDLTNPVVGFKQDYRPLGDNADVEVSVDGGATWETVLAQTAAARGPREDVVPLPMAAGASDVQVRFHHYNVDWDWWWQVDDVFLGNRDCVPAGDGGYVVGNVYSGDDGVVGADVLNLDHDDQAATTTATPTDANLDDGFYWIFSGTPGTNSFEASAAQHGAVVEDVTVTHGEAVRQDFALTSGHIEVDPAEVEHTQETDTTKTTELTVSNTGEVDATVTLRETEGEVDPASAGEGAPVITNELETSVAAAGARGAGSVPAAHDTNDVWEDLANYPRVVMDSRVVNLDGVYYSISGTDGTAAFPDVNKLDGVTGAWEAVAPLPEAASATNAVATSDTIVVSGGWLGAGVSTSTHLYDPATDTWTGGAAAPLARSAAGVALLDGVMYVVGGCTTSACTPMSNSVMAYDIAGDSWETLGNYPVNAAFLACGIAADELVCSGGNGGAATAASYAYDVSADTWSPIADAPADHWAANYATANDLLVVSGGVQGPGVTNNTFAWNGEEWIADVPNPTHAVYRGGMACGIGKVGGSSGGFTPTVNVEQLPGWDCPVTTLVDVPWLTADPMELTIPAGGSATVAVTTDSTGLAYGTYTAGLELVTDTPQEPIAVPVTMEVAPAVGVIEISPTSVSHEVEFGGSDSTDVAFANTGDAGAEVSLAPAEETAWLSIDPDAFSVDAGASVNVAVGTDATGLEAGTYSAAIEVTTDTGQDLADISVTMVVAEEATPPIEIERVQGADRYGTAVAVSQAHDAGVPLVILTTGADYPDALTGSALAASEDIPVLLTRPDHLPQVTAGELDRLQPERVIVLGGPTAISDEVVDTAGAAAGVTPERLFGDNRYETAAEVAAAFGTFGPASGEVFVASGTEYADALTAAARAGMLDSPVLLVRGDRVPAATAAALDALNPSQITVLGGPERIDDSVVERLADWAPVERLFGEDRYHTAQVLAQEWGAVDTVYLTSGQDWPDALAGSARAGSQEVPMLLTRQDLLPAITGTALVDLGVDHVVVLGGDQAVSEDVLDQIRALPRD